MITKFICAALAEPSNLFLDLKIVTVGHFQNGCRTVSSMVHSLLPKDTLLRTYLTTDRNQYCRVTTIFVHELELKLKMRT